MTSPGKLLIATFALTLGAIVMASAVRPQAPAPSTPGAAVSPWPEEPHALAWELFAQATAPVRYQTEEVAAWETWAKPADIFVSHRSHPSWRGKPNYAKPPRTALYLPLGGSTSACTPGENLDPRLNRIEYDFITGRNGAKPIYSTALLKAWLRRHPHQEISMPNGSVSIKAEWTSLAGESDDQKSHYFHHHRDYGSLDGLQSVALAAKVGTHWLFATFEHFDDETNAYNQCLTESQYLQPDPFEYPQQKALASAEPSGHWKRLLAHNGMEITEWKYYRLVGVQTDYTPALGNPIIESTLPTHSSCMTCHAGASADATGLVVQPFVSVGDNGPLGQPQKLLPGVRRLDFVWAFMCMDNPGGSCQTSIQ